MNVGTQLASSSPCFIQCGAWNGVSHNQSGSSCSGNNLIFTFKGVSPRCVQTQWRETLKIEYHTTHMGRVKVLLQVKLISSPIRRGKEQRNEHLWSTTVWKCYTASLTSTVHFLIVNTFAKYSFKNYLFFILCLWTFCLMCLCITYVQFHRSQKRESGPLAWGYKQL